MPVIPLTDHPGNLAPTALCVTRGRGPGIYKTQAGYIACLPDGMALAGYFPDYVSALEAQATALAQK
jgi:hypothetical protein